jgi:DNA polymerase V
MQNDQFYSSSYNGTKAFSQHDVRTANATGFGAAADDYMERGIDLNEELMKQNCWEFRWQVLILWPKR